MSDERFTFIHGSGKILLLTRKVHESLTETTIEQSALLLFTEEVKYSYNINSKEGF